MEQTKTLSTQEFLKSLTILYVEDNEEIRLQLSLFLKRRVGELITAANGQEGLTLFASRQPDMVITDILMPVMDGLAMARAIREQNDDVPIIVTTAYNDDEYFMRSIELSIDRYVLKPTDPHQLITALEKCARLLWRQREQAEANRYLRFVLDIQPNLLMVVNDQRIEYLNRAFLDYLGIESVKQFHDRLEDLQLKVSLDGADYEPINQNNWISRLLKEQEKPPIVYLKRNCPHGAGDHEGEVRPFAVTVNAAPESGKYILTLSDITFIENQMRNLEEIAYTDALTGACNRARLEGVMHAEMHRAMRHRSPLSIVMFDIDHFKKVNDTYGHNAGDDVLKKLIELVKNNLRASDTVARWGGEEFVLITPESGSEDARLLAEKLRKLIEQTEMPQAGGITCSFGVAQYRAHDSIRMLVERADQALYEAKSKGRNQVCVDS
ncbi:GGDEF domain-containing response regulator [Magnetofaba australis]|uniref:diguanylate cyclase n=1 Tax=Magnetofaba australis IT-1 TaxID=1434232 RepID=A0A1Y2K2C7_9PROT|nr:diguanylate cyclase [Magnetofaba australis]OSM02178.1 putative response regulator receiver modulated diguanylate cyclase [Magnetofaba australis IT-1]